VSEVAIIGAGQLGSRHLQALAQLGGHWTVHVVEPFPASVDRAKGRWAEVAQGSSPTLNWCGKVEELPGALEVAIVATSADTRRAATEALLARATVTHLVLEKVLFQSLDDYAPMQALVEKRTQTAWVNCPRRMWAFYRSLRERLLTEETRRLSVSGSKWGLGSNAIHFLDLFAFLGGGSGLTVEALHVAEAPTVRPGFVELSGSLGAHASCGHAAITSFPAGDAPVLVEVSSPNLRAVVREGEGKAWVASSAGKWAWQEEPVEPLPQSRLSHLFVEELSKTGRCGLTPLVASIDQHLAYLTPLARHFGAARCPIT
jgi:predicted dehydrogenase